MPSDRFFFNGLLKSGDMVKLSDKEFHHLAHVMRGKVGDLIELINGKGQIASGRIINMAKRECSIEVGSISVMNNESDRLVLIQALPRLQKLEALIEKGTELGVTEFWLFPGMLSERKSLSDNHIRRLREITQSALKQSGRLWSPQISVREPMSNWPPFDFPVYYGSLDTSAPPLLQIVETNSIQAFCVGPESGFHKDEIAHLEERGAKAVKLSVNTLRTETAAITGIGLLSHHNLVVSHN